MTKQLGRRDVISVGLGAAVAAPRVAHAAAKKESRVSAPAWPWPPRARHPLTGPNQFVLLDRTVRFLPFAPAQPLKPGEQAPIPKTDYPDPEVNHYGDGFKIVWIDSKDQYFLPDRVRPVDVPDSWLAPVNFYGGQLHFRVDVMEKPDDHTLTSLLSRITTESHEGDHNVWLGHGAVTFDKRGLHHFEQPVKAFRPFIRNTLFRFDKPLYELQLMVADSRGAVVHKHVEQAHNAYEGTPNLGLYLPLKVRYTAVVVAEGATFAKPAWW